MTPLLTATAFDDPVRKLTFPIAPGAHYSIDLQFWSKEPEGSAPDKKVALLLFVFHDADGAKVEAPEGLPRNADGVAYRYISPGGQAEFSIGITVPPRAVHMTLEIQPWKQSNYIAEIIRIKGEAETAWGASGLGSRVALDTIRMPSLPQEEAARRFFLEAMLAEAGRQKNDFSTRIEVPSVTHLDASPEHAVALGYVRRRGARGEKPRHLVITTSYPAADNIYASGFLHSRVKGYADADAEVDVMVFARGNRASVRSHQGIDVLSGYVRELTTLLAAGEDVSVSVHFLHPHMWCVIASFLDRYRVYLFIHGGGARSWSRGFDPATGMEAARQQKAQSDLWRDLWHAVLRNKYAIAGFVFVSDWMRQCTEDDMMVLFPTEKVHVIHNPVDTDFFVAQPRSAEHARRVLMIRNFDKYLYATDIAIRCMEELRCRRIWQNLDFTIHGEGRNLRYMRELFGADRNVHIHEGYLTHDQIRDAHRDHGLMLIPTRLDSQGVSRDEAMASGLVPVTNRICAVPEFADDSCAIMAPAEDYLALADGIEALAASPRRFLRMSAAAAARVRAQSARSLTLRQEMTLMGIDAPSAVQH